MFKAKGRQSEMSRVIPGSAAMSGKGDTRGKDKTMTWLWGAGVTEQGSG